VPGPSGLKARIKPPSDLPEGLRGSSDLDGQHLAAAVVATGRARDMAAYTTAALRALGQLRCMPAVCCLPRAQAHL
jgi:hypothetical protein